MKIEIDGNDFKGINDKLGKIRSAAVMARMTTEEEMIAHLQNIVTWTNEILIHLLNCEILSKSEGQNDQN